MSTPRRRFTKVRPQGRRLALPTMRPLRLMGEGPARERRRGMRGRIGRTIPRRHLGGEEPEREHPYEGTVLTHEP